MKEMNKEFEYRGYKFNIKVELETRVTKEINGDKYHTVLINDMGPGNYYKKEEVRDSLLEKALYSLEKRAEDYVNKIIDGRPSHDERLTKLGFK